MSTVNITHGPLGELDVQLQQERPGPGDDACPAAVIVGHHETNVEVMLGRSPIDGKLVLHIDGAIGENGLARVFLNDGLVFGQETE